MLLLLFIKLFINSSQSFLSNRAFLFSYPFINKYIIPKKHIAFINTLKSVMFILQITSTIKLTMRKTTSIIKIFVTIWHNLTFYFNNTINFNFYRFFGEKKNSTNAQLSISAVIQDLYSVFPILLMP